MSETTIAFVAGLPPFFGAFVAILFIWETSLESIFSISSTLEFFRRITYIFCVWSSPLMSSCLMYLIIRRVFSSLPTKIIELVASSLKMSTFSDSMVWGKSFLAILVALGKTSFTEEFLSLITVDRLIPRFSTALMIFEMERSVLGVAVMARTLFSLKEMTLESL